MSHGTPTKSRRMEGLLRGLLGSVAQRCRAYRATVGCMTRGIVTWGCSQLQWVTTYNPIWLVVSNIFYFP